MLDWMNVRTDPQTYLGPQFKQLSLIVTAYEPEGPSGRYLSPVSVA